MALPERAKHKSSSALSRFLNLCDDRSTRAVIRGLRRDVLKMPLERRKVAEGPF
jgi:hypothetical protein